jgi:deaminated glutathione amidase
LFLPEASDYIASNADETVALAKSVTDSEFVLGLQADARRFQLPINVGIHEPAQDGKKVKNTLIWIDEKGDIVQRYQKLHLFDVEIKDGPILRESKYVGSGDSVPSNVSFYAPAISSINSKTLCEVFSRLRNVRFLSLVHSMLTSR